MVGWAVSRGAAETAEEPALRELDDITEGLKNVEQLARQHAKQLLTYLKLTNTPVGLLINFGAPTLREGLRRIVNGFQPSAFPRLRVNQGLPGSANSQGSTEIA